MFLVHTVVTDVLLRVYGGVAAAAAGARRGLYEFLWALHIFLRSSSQWVKLSVTERRDAIIRLVGDVFDEP